VKTFIKSSVKVKPDPQYYIRKANRWGDQRDELFAEVDRLEAEAGRETPESLAVHRKAMSLHDKVMWANSRIVPASNLFHEQRKSVACPECGEPAGRPCVSAGVHGPSEMLCWKRGRVKGRV
jgi:hypothetical protein